MGWGSRVAGSGDGHSLSLQDLVPRCLAASGAVIGEERLSSRAGSELTLGKSITQHLPPFPWDLEAFSSPSPSPSCDYRGVCSAHPPGVD